MSTRRSSANLAPRHRSATRRFHARPPARFDIVFATLEPGTLPCACGILEHQDGPLDLMCAGATSEKALRQGGTSHPAVWDGAM